MSSQLAEEATKYCSEEPKGSVMVNKIPEGLKILQTISCNPAKCPRAFIK